MTNILKKCLLLMILFLTPIIKCNASDLEIIPIEYVNGDSALLKSENEYLLIDVGYDNLDAIIDVLTDNGVTSSTPINIYLSHYHSDHFGGGYSYKMNLVIDGEEQEHSIGILGYLLGNYNVKKLYLPKPYLDEVSSEANSDVVDDMNTINKFYKRFVAVAEKYNVNVVTLDKGSKFSFGNTTAEVLYQEREANYENNNKFINNNSLVTMFTNGKTKFLTAGDIEEEAESEILELNIDISADIFKLNHHAGWSLNHHSNTADFVRAINPKYFYAQIRYTLDDINYNVISGSLSELLSFSNMYSNLDIQSYKNGEILTNGNIKFIIKDDEITPVMEKNSHTITINYIDEESGEVIKTKKYDFSATETYYLYDYRKTFEGYTLSKGEDDIAQTGTLSSDQTYTIYYNKNNYTLTIKHVNEKGEILAEEQQNYKYKDNYTTQVSDELLLKYNLVDEINSASGIITEDTTVTYVYKEKNIISEPIIPDDGKTENEAPYSPPTGDALIIFVWILGIVTLIYSGYYFLKVRKEN